MIKNLPKLRVVLSRTSTSRISLWYSMVVGTPDETRKKLKTFHHKCNKSRISNPRNTCNNSVIECTLHPLDRPFPRWSPYNKLK